MKLEQVKMREGQALLCCICHRWSTKPIADLDGAAFRAYYCPRCCPALVDVSAACPMLLAVVQHVLAMADDAYFMGHPEWASIVEQARSAIQHQNHEEN